MEQDIKRLRFNPPESIKNLKVNYRIIKPKTPIIYIDSNFIIEFSKIKLGKQNNNKIKILYNKLMQLSYSKKYAFCFTELNLMEFLRDKQKEPQVISTFSSIANASRFKNYFEVEDDFTCIGYKYYMERTQNPEINYKDVIVDDDLFSKSQHKFTIYSSKFKNLLKDEDIDITETINKLRLEDAFAPTYSERLFENNNALSTSFARASFKLLNPGIYQLTRYENRIINLAKDITTFYKLPISNFSHIIEFNKFLASEYYINLPFQIISSSLLSCYGKGSKYKKSDTNDLRITKSIFPFCTYFLTDKSLKTKLIDTKINKKFDVKVFSLSNIDDFFEVLKQD